MTKLTGEDMAAMRRAGIAIPGHSDVLEILNAAWNNDVTRLQSFVTNHGAEFIDVCTSEGKTALMQAASVHCAAAFDFLLANGADIEARDELGRTILMNDIPGILPRSSTDFLLKVLSAAPDLEARDFNGMTALLHAVKESDLEGVRTLIDHGADIYAVTKSGQDAGSISLNRKTHQVEISALIEARHQSLQKAARIAGALAVCKTIGNGTAAALPAPKRLHIRKSGGLRV